MKFAVWLLAGVVFTACATTPPIFHDAPHPSDACILLSLGKDAGLAAELDKAEAPLLRQIQTQELPAPTYQCGDVSYQTDPRYRGLAFRAIGFSADHRYAALSMQSVPAPLAGRGYTCLYEAEDQSWTLRGCRMDWIS